MGESGDALLLTGTFARALDDKQRIAVPKPIRDALGPAADAGLFVAPGTDGSLAIYTETALADLAARLGQKSPAGQEVRAFSRLFYSRAQRVEIDSQGRIRLPLDLLQGAGVAKEAMLIGVQDHLELWAPERWAAYLTAQQDRYDQLAEGAFGG